MRWTLPLLATRGHLHLLLSYNYIIREPFDDDTRLLCCLKVWKTNNKRSKCSTEGKDHWNNFWSGCFSYFTTQHSEMYETVPLRAFNLVLFVSQSHSYVNLTDLDLTAESVSQSGAASLTNNISRSQSRAESLSSQMARLSKYCDCHTYLYTEHVQYCSFILHILNLWLFFLQAQVNQTTHYHRK